MTENNDTNNTDERLQALMQAAAEPGAGARERAVQAALAAFDQVQGDPGQGSGDPARPTSHIKPMRRKRKMETRTWMMSGLASAAVLTLAVALTLQMQPLDHEANEAGPPAEFGVPSLAGAGHDASLRQAESKARENLAVQERTISEKRQAQPNARYDIAASAPAMVAEMAAGHAAMPSRSRELQLAPDSKGLADYRDSGRDAFPSAADNPVRVTSVAPVSTFSVDVDTASYSFVRRQLREGVLPARDAVRLEEMVNYFPYDYAPPTDRRVPFATHVSVVAAPWNESNRLVHIALKGYEAPPVQPRTNLVFLLDVSGSMNSPDKLPLVKQSLTLLLDQLQAEDTVAIVVYAGAAGAVLPPTPVSERQKIVAALQQLQAGGSTAGGAGIKLAYQLAESTFIEGGINRVFLATDGDFNVGIRSPEELKGFVERQRESGIYLSVLGFGQGNYHDNLMQALAQNGNGIAAYIDTLAEARKVLVDEASAMLFPIAGDVKVQVEFNPATVSEYRLLGYETRALRREDFNNDRVDAGEIGAGHAVTAIYEITPVGGQALVDPLRYGDAPAPAAVAGEEYGFLKLRYKLPGESQSRLLSAPIPVAGGEPGGVLRREVDFSLAVAGFAQLLRGGRYTGEWSLDDALALALANRGSDDYGYRSEFVQLIRQAQVADALP